VVVSWPISAEVKDPKLVLSRDDSCVVEKYGKSTASNPESPVDAQALMESVNPEINVEPCAMRV
jgi:hypothetical protein